MWKISLAMIEGVFSANHKGEFHLQIKQETARRALDFLQKIKTLDGK